MRLPPVALPSLPPVAALHLNVLTMAVISET